MKLNNPFDIQHACTNRLARFKTENPQLRIVFHDGTMEFLTEQEAEVLQDAMFIEYCGIHKGFHLVNDLHLADAVMWLTELRRN